MKVASREIGKINDHQSMVEILNENNEVVEWVVCSYYDSWRPFGAQWDWGHYFSSFASACDYAAEIRKQCRMEYGDFYDIASYGNEMWKGSFSQKETAENAYIYYVDFQYSKQKDKVANNIKELMKLLAEDGSDECKEWLYNIKTELDLIDKEGN